MQSFVNFHIDILLLIDVNWVRLASLPEVYSAFHFLILIWVNRTYHVVVLTLFLLFVPKFLNNVLGFLKDRENLLHIIRYLFLMIYNLNQILTIFSYFYGLVRNILQYLLNLMYVSRSDWRIAKLYHF